MVDMFDGKLQDYTIINYLAQGGVAVIMHRAMIAVERHLHEKKYKTYMIHTVHDELVLALNIWEYYNTNIIQEICAIMGQQMPQFMLNKTIPAVAFVTELCPSNSQKWGLRIGRDYPLPMDE
jgi:DNA polymerase I-like protein with 3'-5' exonuclease and polymerase domains